MSGNKGLIERKREREKREREKVPLAKK